MKKELKKVLAPVEKAVGKRIRKFQPDVQEDAWMVAYIAYLEGKDMMEALILWNRKRRQDNKKVLFFTSARPLRQDKKALKEIQKGYY